MAVSQRGRQKAAGLRQGGSRVPTLSGSLCEPRRSREASESSAAAGVSGAPRVKVEAAQQQLPRQCLGVELVHLERVAEGRVGRRQALPYRALAAARGPHQDDPDALLAGEVQLLRLLDLKGSFGEGTGGRGIRGWHEGWHCGERAVRGSRSRQPN